MKLFGITSVAIAVTIALFLIFISVPGLTLVLCPTGLVLLWLNGFAASRLNVSVSIKTTETPTIQPAAPAPRIKPVRRSEYE